MDYALLLIPGLPFLGFLANGLLGRRLPHGIVSFVGCAAPAGAFLVAMRLACGTHAVDLGAWISAGDLSVPLGFRMDVLSAVMALVVTGVGTLIHVYSVGYMHGDKGYARFFAYMNLFTAFMLVLVLADNLLVLFVGWEGVGLCSYLLIGFWHGVDSNCDAGRKAFVVNRVGDLAFLMGVLLIWSQFGTISFTALSDGQWGAAAWVYPAAALLLFGGACGKSAQIPLHVWLPDAMAGPTPVSALIHAATMVTAGVYLVARMSWLYAAAPEVGHLVAWVGVVTAVAAGAIALVQTDIKKVLAYSTVSQLGFMFVAAGLGAYGVAIFHLVTHAFFKALLFLGAGAVIHALGGEQDLRKMGGLWRRLPFTGAVILVGCLALAGIPPLAGFASKDAILWAAWTDDSTLAAAAILASAFTAIYAFRLFALAFLGRPGAWPHAPHEAPLVMAAPLAALAAGSVLAGALAWPEVLGGREWLLSTIAPVLAPAAHHAADHGAELVLMGTVAALAGFLAFLAVLTWATSREATVTKGLVHLALVAKLGFDDLYDLAVIGPLLRVSHRGWRMVDLGLIDGAIHGAVATVGATASALSLLHLGRVRAYAAWIACGAAALTLWLVLR